MELNDSIFSFEDLYLDVWQQAGKEAVLLDEDELQAAVECGHIDAGEAGIATGVVRQLL